MSIYSLVLLTIIFCNFLGSTNGSLASVSRKLNKLQIDTSPTSLMRNNLHHHRHQQQQQQQEQKQQQQSPRPRSPSFSPKSSPKSFIFNDQPDTDTKEFLDLRSEAYIDRFGSNTPDFDQYITNMETLRSESEFNKKTK